MEDFSGSNPNGGNDRLLLEVRRSNQSGTLGVLFSGLEFNGVGIENFDFFALDPLLTSNSTADQILLSLSKDENSAVVDAEFSLFAGGSFLLSQGLDNVGNTSAMIASLYTDEAFTRAALHTIENTEVPEPGAIALLGVGIAGIGFLRRRKTK